MADHLRHAFSFDIRAREGIPEKLPARGAKIKAQEVEEGLEYENGPLRVSAFAVDHGAVKPAFGHRVDCSKRSVVISGDTKFCQNLVDFSKGADCLIHVAWSAESVNRTPRHVRSLASVEDAADVFVAVRPKLGVISHYHQELGLLEAIRGKYKGRCIVAKGLTVIKIGKTIRC